MDALLTTLYLALLYGLLIVPVAIAFSPGCTCCDCEYFADTFDRSNSTDIGSDWTETAGDWSIDANTLSVTTANAIATCNVAAPTNSMKVKLTMDAGVGINNAVRCMVSYQDSDNYLCVEFERNAAAPHDLRLIRRASGSETTLASTTTSYSTFSANVNEVCWDDDRGILSCQLGQPGGPAEYDILSAVTTGFGTSTIAVGTGATMVGTARFNTLRALKIDSPCEPCYVTCSHCTDGQEPRQFQIVFAGITDPNPADALDCNCRNLTAIVDVTPGNDCLYQLLAPGCGLTGITLTIKANSYLVKQEQPFFGAQQWENSGLSTPRDCFSPSGLSLPFATFGNPHPFCSNYAASTATITAIP